MSRYVVDASAVLHLLSEGVEVASGDVLLAPTLIRSQVLEALYRAVRSGELRETVGLERLARFAEMKIRYLGDKVLRRRAWVVAAELGWDSTKDAEYIALTQLQADAFVTLDPALASTASRVVPTASIDALR